MPIRPRHTPAGLAALVTAALSSAAVAGGYDTPMLYSARHMGMGGAAAGYVDDPSALFHNPAGLAHTKRFTALGDFSLLLGKVNGSPAFNAQDRESELTVAPMFLLGGAYRLTDWLTFGLGVYPNASAGASYEYVAPGSPDTITNRTRLVFIEGSPAVAVNLPGRLRLGAGYRITYVSLQRFQGQDGATPGLDFEMAGFDWTGFRVGAQWTALDWLQVGASYRHRTTTTVKNDTGIALGATYTDISTDFTLPSKLVAGARADAGAFGVAVDGEYLWNSQNQGDPLRGTPPSLDYPDRVPNIFEWSNAVTVRGGLEYRLLPSTEGVRRLALRAGWIYDGATTNPKYPSAFGTPPGPTNIATAGAGWNAGRTRVNLAYAYRFGEGAVTAADLNAPGRKACAFCGTYGNEPYELRMHGLYVDLSWALD